MFDEKIMNQEIVSWFKLYESIVKNEKEKVLVAFRLLSYSLESESLRYQVLGNIYTSLDEYALGLEAYQKALEAASRIKDWFGVGLIIYYIQKIDMNEALKNINLYKKELNKDFVNLALKQ